MVSGHQFKVGDTVTWKPEYYEYRDRHKCPHEFTITKIDPASAVLAGDYPSVWWGPTNEHCPAAKPEWLQLAEGPW